MDNFFYYIIVKLYLEKHFDEMAAILVTKCVCVPSFISFYQAHSCVNLLEMKSIWVAGEQKIGVGQYLHICGCVHTYVEGLSIKSIFGGVFR